MSQSSTVSYADILRDLSGFDEWLSTMGVPIRDSDRAHNAIRILEKAQYAFTNGLEDSEAGVSKTEYLFGLTEALELRDVYQTFRNNTSQELRKRLIRALSGPALPEAETEKNSDGRNIMFELAFGAEWAEKGAKIELCEPDLGAKLQNRYYLVACKRPNTEDGVTSAVKDAGRQLRSALTSAPDSCLGLIVISFSRILNRGTKFFSGSYDDLSELLNGMLTRNRQTWNDFSFHPNTIAIIFHMHTPANWGQGLFRMAAMRVDPFNSTAQKDINDLKNDLENLYS
jgi:hypothetical protein